MANIPGISGSVMPNVFSRDQIRTTGVSIPGGVRVLAIIGEGRREETVVSSAVGGGHDGLSPDYSGTANPDGRHFALSQFPIVVNRTTLLLNGIPLNGLEAQISSLPFDREFDFRIDSPTGHIEMQRAGLVDQGGKFYIRGASNFGDGYLNILEVADPNAPSENWTLRCAGVTRDGYGRPVSNTETLILTGTVSGQVKRANGSPILFNIDSTGADGYYAVDYPFIGLNSTTSAPVRSDAFFAKPDFADPLGYSPILSPASTNLIRANGGAFLQAAPGDTVTIDVLLGSLVVSQVGAVLTLVDASSFPTSFPYEISFAGQTRDVLSAVGDVLTLDSAFSPAPNFVTDVVTTVGSTYIALITVVHNDKVIETDTPIAVTNPEILASGEAPSTTNVTGYPIVVTAPKVLHTSTATFNATVIGKSIRSLLDDFLVLGIIQESVYSAGIIHTLRLSGTLTASTDPLSLQPWTTFQTNGLINVCILEGLQPFDVGDRFDFVVFSRRLNQNDNLVARYIAIADINAPTFFTEVNDVYAKHGRPSVENTLSLGAQLAFTNGAPGIFCVGAAPGLARRTSEVLLSVTDGITPGMGFIGSTTNPTVDALRVPLSPGALPDIDTDVHIFIDHRDAATGTVTELQIFPNKIPFYDSANSGPVNEQAFVDNNHYSYTMILDHNILQSGEEGSTDKTKPLNFSSLDAQFQANDANNALGVGNVIRLVGGAKADGTRFDSFNDSTIISATDIANGIVAADGSIALRISKVLSSTTVQFTTVPIDLTTSAPFATIVSGTFGGFLQNLSSVDWQLIDASQNVVLTASILFSKDVVTNGTIQQGDGIRISYIDHADAPFFDPNWLLAYESLETVDCQMVCPLPSMTISSIFRQGVTHCESQSYIINQHERVLLIGAIQGITTDAILGNTEVAVEDIGILEGIQGASPQDVLEGNIEDLADYSIVNNFGNTSRVEYFFPDQIVVNVSGQLTALSGYYIAAAAGGYFANNQNIAEPLTNKSLSGFTILSSRQFKPSVINQLAGIGVTVVQPVTGGGKVLWSKTTSNSGFPEDEEVSIRFARDRVQRVMRDGLRGLIGTVETPATAAIMTTRAVSILNALVSQGLITSFNNVSVVRDKVEPRQWNVFARYSPAYPIDFIFIDLEVGVS